MELSTVVAVAELLQKEKKTFRLGLQKKHYAFDAKNNFYSKLMKKPSKNQLRHYPTNGLCLFVRTLYSTPTADWFSSFRFDSLLYFTTSTQDP